MNDDQGKSGERPKKGPPARPSVEVPDLETELEDLKPLPVHSEPPEKEDE